MVEFLRNPEQHPIAWVVVWLLAGIPIAWLLARGTVVMLPTEAAPLGINIYPEGMRILVAGFIFYAIYGLLLSTWVLLRVKTTMLRRLVWWAWAVIPPLWFVVEYFFVYPAFALDPLSSFDAFKYGQGVASKLWAAGLAMASAAHFVELSREGRKPTLEQ